MIILYLLVQCDTGNDGCDGGEYAPAFDYMATPSGVETSSDYPYTSYYGITGGPCAALSFLNVVSVTSWDDSLSGDEGCMAHYVQNTGTLAVAVDANDWNYYEGGIMSHYSCGQDLDHAVQIVGVYPAASGGYWKIRNTWGTSWGGE